jgi:hypothetical protein
MAVMLVPGNQTVRIDQSAGIDAMQSVEGMLRSLTWEDAPDRSGEDPAQSRTHTAPIEKAPHPDVKGGSRHLKPTLSETTRAQKNAATRRPPHFSSQITN